ncbi:MAG TPA: methyltransferase domain-containing protein [Gaiellaceae bacterium]|nr:methyltransferase domain-containing protein [Gaiellaceae bacterium]
MPRHRDRERLRVTFGSVAEQYDRARPSYPDAIFDDLAAIAGLRPGSRVVEVGPGTGKATVELVRRGYAVTGVELSPDLAEVARRNAPGAEIVVSNFETWEPAAAGFDAIVATAAYHWIASELRYAKPLALLKPGGALAVVHGWHVFPPDGDPVWAAVQEDYDAVVPHPDNGPPPPPEEIVDEWGDEFHASGVFERVEARRHLQELVYTADEYVDVLGTFSDNLVLPAAQRDELFRRIHARIAARPGGTVTKHYLLELTLGLTPA